MRKLWVCSAAVWEQYSEMRSGIRIRFEKGVSEEVKQACIRFIRWLRVEYCFPVRVHLYFKKSRQIKSIDGELASAAFWGPYDKTKEPHIRIAVGDYEELRNERGRDHALAAVLHSIVHELSHYFQWLKNRNEWEQADKKTMNAQERQAVYYAREIVMDYAEIVEHP